EVTLTSWLSAAVRPWTTEVMVPVVPGTTSKVVLPSVPLTTRSVGAATATGLTAMGLRTSEPGPVQVTEPKAHSPSGAPSLVMVTSKVAVSPAPTVMVSGETSTDIPSGASTTA